MIIRRSKIILVWALALYMTLVAFGNIVDYSSNFTYIVNVMKMGETFQTQMWRAVDTAWLHHLAYMIIIAVEVLVAILCWLGGWRLQRQIPGNATRFNQAKGMAIIGLTLAVLLTFTGFITIAGEWFLMWQAKTANVQNVSFQLATMVGIILIYTALPDSDEQ